MDQGFSEAEIARARKAALRDIERARQGARDLVLVRESELVGSPLEERVATVVSGLLVLGQDDLLLLSAVLLEGVVDREWLSA